MGRFDDDDDDLLGLDDDDEGTIDPGGTDAAGEGGAREDDADDGPPQTRAARRAERGKLFNALQESQRREREALERLSGLQAAQLAQQQTQQRPQLDPYEVEIAKSLEEDKRIREFAQAKYKEAVAAGKELDPAQVRQWDDAVELNNIRRQNLIAERAARKVQAEVNPARIAAEEAGQAEYNDVRQHPKAIEWAKLTYAQRLIERGQQADSPALRDEVYREARAKFGLARTRGPSEGDRRRFVSAGGGGIASANSRSTTRNGGALSSAERKLAEAMYDKFPPSKAHQMWAKNVGSKTDRE